MGAVVLGAVLGGPGAASAATAHPPAPGRPVAAAFALRPAAPALTLKSAAGLPDQAVSFTAVGFRAHETVTLHWRTATGTKLATVKASKAGVAAGIFHVPLPRAGVAAKVSLVAVGAASKRTEKAAFTQSCTDEWTELTGGIWGNPRNWSAGAVPGASTAACVTLAGLKKYTVRVQGRSATVGSLQLGTASGKTTQTLALVAGDFGITVTLKHASTVRADGVLRLTSVNDAADAIAGPGPLDNGGLLRTDNGDGGNRYFYGAVVNEAGGAVDLDADLNQFDGGAAFTNDGTLDLGTAAVLKLAGSSAGGASLRDGAESSTEMAVGATAATRSLIEQPRCPAAACRQEVISVAGRLAVAAPGAGLAGQYVLAYSNANPVRGTFTPARAFSLAYNGARQYHGSVTLTLP